jgi:hypothetical protein
VCDEMPVAKLNHDTHVLLDGAAKVYLRGNSKRWQATFQIGGHLIRISIGERDLAEAKTVAREQYLDYKFRSKHDFPDVTKQFVDVARLSIVDMQRQLDAGAGRKVSKDYMKVIENYFIPFFGKTFITNIDHEKIQAFNAWRVQKISHEPKTSTLNTHNLAMNKGYAEAVARGFVSQGKVPILANNGEEGKRIPDFSLDDYCAMIRDRVLTSAFKAFLIDARLFKCPKTGQ